MITYFVTAFILFVLFILADAQQHILLYNKHRRITSSEFWLGFWFYAIVALLWMPVCLVVVVVKSIDWINSFRKNEA